MKIGILGNIMEEGKTLWLCDFLVLHGEAQRHDRKSHLNSKATGLLIFN